MKTTINKKDPTISIIIVSKNDYENLLVTYSSFDFPGNLKKTIQLILVDGSSTDETYSFIKSHSTDFSKIITEPDLGIYDAMNKGIRNANGEWIIFMNTGDTFADPGVLTTIMDHLTPDTDVLYGDCILKYPTFNLRYFISYMGRLVCLGIPIYQFYINRFIYVLISSFILIFI